MKKTLLVVSHIVLLCAADLCPGAGKEPRINVKADQVMFRLSDYMTGANLEDLNYQLTGGLYSQLICGESFEEPSSPNGVSRHWQEVRRGSAHGAFECVTKNTFNGRQDQQVTFADGQGEIGMDNAGLNRWGINLVKDRPYEGLVRMKTPRPADVHVSLLSADGRRKLAEKVLKTKGIADEYQRFEFTLAPDASDEKGRFALTLSGPGSMTIGYVFLQPGPWGRYKDLPLRKDLVEAIIAQGIKVIRFNGSMINPRPQTGYKWKSMIGPRDERPPYTGTFNPFAGNGFGIIDFLNMCEAAGILPIPGLNMGETPEDLADFVEYVNGPASSRWGRKRAADGHGEPYNLKFIQLGNEERIDADYAAKFKAAAKAIWDKDASITLVAADWMYPSGIGDPNRIGGARCGDLSSHVDIIKFCAARRGRVWWDVHVWDRAPRDADTGRSGLQGIRDLKQHLSKLVPEWDAKIAALELNAGAHDMARALGHAHAMNELERMGDYVPAVCTPNTLQPWGQYTTRRWDQGMIFFTPTKVWFQPPAHVDRMMSRNRAPNVVKCDFASPWNVIDATAKKSDDGRKLTLQVVNVDRTAVKAEVTIDGFSPGKPVASVEEMAGNLADANTLEEPEKIKPAKRFWEHNLSKGPTSYTFPAHSFTVLVFE